MSLENITCEMCGSNNLTEENGVYTCQNCGTKFTPKKEEKTIINNVSTDGDNAENLKVLAKRYYSNKNYQKAKDYFNRVLEKNPNDWEAIFYEGLSSTYTSTMLDFHVMDMVLGAENAIAVIPPEEHDQRAEDFRKELIPTLIVFGGYVISNTNSNCSKGEVLAFFNNLKELIVLSERVLTDFPPASVVKGDQTFILYKNIVNWANLLNQTLKYNWGYNQANTNPIYKNINPTSDILQFADLKKKQYTREVLLLDDSYVPPKTNRGCYVATSIYGSYDCPEVWTLRRFRDYYLEESFMGRLFIKFYYATSPTLVKYFGNTKIFKKIFEGPLNSFVKKLQDKGYESVEYNDIK